MRSGSGKNALASSVGYVDQLPSVWHRVNEQLKFFLVNFVNLLPFSEVDKHSGVVFLSVSCEYASVAQLVRAPASYAGGCGFESHRWYQGFGKDFILLGVVAQEGEQRREAAR